MSPVLDLACALIARPSITPDDAGCQVLLAERLQRSGWQITHLPFGEVSNLWATHGHGTPVLAFAGHTDVVPPGPRERWRHDPFTPTVVDGRLYGRGAADMKGSLAAMVVACERFLARADGHRGTLAFLLTSDEEGAAVDGTARVVEWLSARGIGIDYCVIGEPSSSERLGDTVKNGRRGSLHGRLVVHGTQGHVAYPERVDNPIHRIAHPLAELSTTEWDRGNAFFPPTSFQVTNIHAGTGATNVVCGEVELLFNFRFSTEVTPDELKVRVERILDAHGLRYEIDWHLSGRPFLTAEGALLEATREAVRRHTGRAPALSTAGGTSDGRFIAPTGAEVIELGPLNASIHKVDEHVAVADLDTLSLIYEDIMLRLLGTSAD